jgi:hypothetical protein
MLNVSFENFTFQTPNKQHSNSPLMNDLKRLISMGFQTTRFWRFLGAFNVPTFRGWRSPAILEAVKITKMWSKS